MPISVSITKEVGNVTHKYEDFHFPATSAELRKALESLGFTTADIYSFYFTDIEQTHHDIYSMESDVEFPETLSLTAADNLNHLAKLIDGLADDDRHKLFHIYEYASKNITVYPFEDIEDMIDVAHNMDKFTFIPEIENAWQLSDHCIHTGVIDGEDAKLLLAGKMTKQEHGHKIMESEHGGFVTWGYVAGGDNYEPFVMDDGIPQADRVWMNTIDPLVSEDTRKALNSIFEQEIHYEQVCDGHTGIASFTLACRVAENIAGGEDHSLLGGIKAKAATIIEIAGLIEHGDGECVEKLLENDISRMNPTETQGLLIRLKDYARELDMQWAFEYGAAYDPDKIGDFVNVLEKYPEPLRENEDFLDNIMSRSLYEEAIRDLEGQLSIGRVQKAGDEAIRAFRLLPTDVQVRLEIQKDTDVQFQTIMLENAKKMVDLLGKKIDGAVQAVMLHSNQQGEPGQTAPVPPVLMGRQSLTRKLGELKKDVEQRNGDSHNQRDTKQPDR